MSLQQLYETVVREEEYIMHQRQSFAQKIRDEFLNSDTQYCGYCMEARGDRWHCCGENHWATFKELSEEDQKEFVENAIEEYEEWSRK